jgi:hypothetical protein
MDAAHNRSLGAFASPRLTVQELVTMSKAASGGHGCFSYSGPTVLVVREQIGLRIVNPDESSWDEASRLLSERPADVQQFTYFYGVREHGVWAVTGVDEVAGLVCVGGGNFTEANHSFARFAIVEWLDARRELRHVHASALAASDVESHAVRLTGYLHNIASVVAFVAFVCSLAWLPAAPAHWRDRRRRRDLARGLCPSCGYSVVGLNRPVCPECGASLTTS